MKTSRLIVLGCRMCNEELTSPTFPLLAGQYLLHCIQKHWEMVEMLHRATPEKIEEGYMHAELEGWI